MANRHQWFNALLTSATFLISTTLYADTPAEEQPKSAIKTGATAIDKTAAEAKEIQRQLGYASDQQVALRLFRDLPTRYVISSGSAPSINRCRLINLYTAPIS